MEYKLQFADVVFHILSEREIELEPQLQPFLAAETEPADLTVQVSWDSEHVKLPDSGWRGRTFLLLHRRCGAVLRHPWWSQGCSGLHPLQWGFQ